MSRSNLVCLSVLLFVCFQHSQRAVDDPRDFVAATSDLAEAVKRDDVQSVRVLLKTGADPNFAQSNNITPIFRTSNLEVIDLLIAHGANLSVRTAMIGHTPLENAAWQANNTNGREQAAWSAVVEHLRFVGAEYSLRAAIYLNDLEFVREEFTKDAAVVNGSRNTPLRLAFSAGHIEICRHLLEKGANPNTFADGCGFPILVNAVLYPKIVRLLIKFGADVNDRISWSCSRSGPCVIGDGATALHFAVQARATESVKILLDSGADPNAVDDLDQTALHIALQRACSFPGMAPEETPQVRDILECLLSHEASTGLHDQYGRTPMKVAIENDWPDSIRRLVETK